MATVTVVPDGDLATENLSLTTGTDSFEMVNDTIAGADDATSELFDDGNNTDVDTRCTLEAMPSDFDTAIDVQLRVRTEITGLVDDSADIQAWITETGEGAALSGAFVTNSGNHSWTTTSDDALANTDNKATWDGREVRMLVARTNSGMPDAITRAFTAIEVVLNYTATGNGGLGMPLVHYDHQRRWG